MSLTAPVLVATAAVVAAGGAGALLVDPQRGSSAVGAGTRRRPVRRPAQWLATVPAAVLVVAVAADLQGRHLGLVLVLGVAVLGVLRGVERARGERRAHERRVQVVDYCEALVGELRSGQPVVRAVERSSETWHEARTIVSAAQLGASVPSSMRRLGEQPGAAALRKLAGAWEISASTGAGLVLAVEQVLATVRAEEATARLVRAELAAARATARLVTGLPLVVLLAAQGIGARPWHFLFDTTAGVTCLGGGVGLSLLGLAWIDRIAARSTEPGS